MNKFGSLGRDKFNIIYSFVLIPMFLVIVMYLAYGWLNYVTLTTLSIKSILFSFLIITLLNIVLLFFTKSTKISITVICILFFLLLIINQLKLLYMGDPLFISDLNFLQNYKNISTFTGTSFFRILVKLFCRSIPIIMLLLFMIFIAYKFNVNIERKKIRGASFFTFIFLIFGLYPNLYLKKIYLNYLYRDAGRNNLEYYDSYKILYGYYGLIGGMHYQYLNSLLKYDEPDNYDKNKLEKLENESFKVETKVGTPNIVVILSESFFDVENLKDDITFNKPITSNYNRLKGEGSVVNVISPSFGSMTSNVTFELLTGGNMTYFDVGYVPFLDLYRDNKSRPSLVKELKNSGYDTSIILGGDSYNSGSLMKRIGFSNYELVESNGHIKGFYVSDDYMADLVIEELSKNNKRNFCMVETMESHLRYKKDKFDNYDIKVAKSNLSTSDTDVLLSYAQGIYDADLMLNKVYNYINSIDEETIIVFFGDHLPLLQDDDFNDISENLKYFNTDSDLINTYRKYNTEALILSNYELDLDIPEYLGYDLLLTYLINHFDIELAPYYRWLYSTSYVLPTYNRFVAVDSNGKINYTSKLAGTEAKMYDLRNQMIYKEFIDS